MSSATTDARGDAVPEHLGDRPAVPDECLLRPGHTNCGGCGMSVGLTMFGRALAAAGERSTLVIPACCGIVAAGGFPTTSYGVPTVATTFAAAPAFASGIAAVRDINDDGGQVICWAGDGGTYDIGLATLSAAAERDENLIYVCYDNEIYGNTGGQRSSATPLGANTTTTPHGKELVKKDVLAIMAAHRVPYCASVSLAHADDAVRKLSHAAGLGGFRFIHILSPCPTGWKSEPAHGIELIRLAVRSGLYPVYEVVDGGRPKVNIEPEMSQPALERYFELQGRFRSDAIDLNEVRASIERSWARIDDRVLALRAQPSDAGGGHG